MIITLLVRKIFYSKFSVDEAFRVFSLRTAVALLQIFTKFLNEYCLLFLNFFVVLEFVGIETKKDYRGFERFC